MDLGLIQKYDVAVPRYTSYPPVPMWNLSSPEASTWYDEVQRSYDEKKGMSLYIHLPFCEQLCTYCGCNKRITKNHDVEIPYIKTVLKEWQSYAALFSNKNVIISELHLGGGSPTFFSPKNIKLLIDGLTEVAALSKDAALSFEAHPHSTNKEYLDTLYALGFRRMSLGVQDLSPKIMKAINRIQNQDEIEFVTNYAREIGFESINYDLIYGLPFQTASDIEITTSFVKRMKPDRIAYYSYAHVPWKSAGQRAFSDMDIPQGLEKYKLKEMANNNLLSMGYESIGMDHFALPSDSLFKNFTAGTMQRNFMGYTDRKTSLLIGLGSSSISESNNMYVQNDKTIETYKDKIEACGNAFIKGHFLSNGQKIVSRHIHNIMCQYETHWENTLEDQVIRDYILGNLKQLSDDNLVTINQNGLRVEKEGKEFIRNICAAVDPEYREPKDFDKVYSTST